MKRFRYRLERFLTIRRYRERELEHSLAEAAGACLATERGIDETRRGVARTFRVPVGEETGVDLEWMRSAELHRLRLQHRMTELETELVRRRRKMSEVREKYLVASKERKVLDKLRERRERDYVAGQKRDELKTLDEVGAAMHRSGRRT